MTSRSGKETGGAAVHAEDGTADRGGALVRVDVGLDRPRWDHGRAKRGANTPDKRCNGNGVCSGDPAGVSTAREGGAMSEEGETSPRAAAALGTADDAWNHFTTRMLPYLLTRDPQVHAACAPEDEVLAAFLRSHPGEFEATLPEYASRLAVTTFPDPSIVSWLSLLFEVTQGDPRLYRTFASLNPAVGLSVCCQAGFRHFDALSETARQNIGYLAQMFIKRLTPVGCKMADLPPELCDSASDRDHLPDILPDDLDGMSPRDIEAVIEAYVRAPIRAFESRLRPGGLSESGFLAPGELLGEVIWEDARKLRELGVRRHALAGGMQQAFALFKLNKAALPLRHVDGWERADAVTAEEQSERAALELDPHHHLKLREIERRSPSTYAVQAQLDVSARGYMGFQHDPFHTLPWHSTNYDFRIKNPAVGPQLAIEGSTMTITLIRRLGFFEGRVPHRIDPELAARVLGLVS